MKRLLFYIALLFIAFSCEGQLTATQSSMFQNNMVTEKNAIFIILDLGQSNSIGRATSERIEQLTKYKESPGNIYAYFKPDYTATDNGDWNVYQEGSSMTKEPDQATTLITGSYGVFAGNIRKFTQNQIYVIPAGDGGTALELNLSTPDWDPTSTAECFEIFLDRYYIVAYDKIKVAYPDFQLVPVIMWHQGENDAADATATANYATNFAAFVTALRARHYSLRDALLIITKLHYNIDANEATINAAFQAYADANPETVKIIDISSVNRKVDLTVDEKGGVATAGADDQHTSYLGQIKKGEDAYTHVKARYFPWYDDSEITTNTGFDPSTLSASGIRLQCNRDNLTIGTNSTVTAVANNLSTGTFSTTAGTPKFKIKGRKGALEFLSLTNAYIQSSAAIGSTLIDGSFSFAFWTKPRDGVPSATTVICHDIQSTGTPNNSRIQVYLPTSGLFTIVFAISGTSISIQATTVPFANGNVLRERHIAVTFTQGELVRIYFDGVLQTLDATFNGDISAFTLANYVNTTNQFTIGARRTGASTYADYYPGDIREFTWNPGVVYTQADILNLMKN